MGSADEAPVGAGHDRRPRRARARARGAALVRPPHAHVGHPRPLRLAAHDHATEQQRARAGDPRRLLARRPGHGQRHLVQRRHRRAREHRRRLLRRRDHGRELHGRLRPLARHPQREHDEPRREHDDPDQTRATRRDTHARECSARPTRAAQGRLRTSVTQANRSLSMSMPWAGQSSAAASSMQASRSSWSRSSTSKPAATYSARVKGEAPSAIGR